jgi:AcrR family transcriptional regulator
VAAVKPRRPYRSALRIEAARATRTAVLKAAHELFVEQGYVASTLDQIADRAGVSKPTVFATIGSKRELFKVVRDVAIAGDEAPIPLVDRPWYRQVLAEPDPRRFLRLHARNCVQIQARYAEIDDVLRAAAGADAELQTLWQTSERERRFGATVVVDSLLKKTRLKKGLTRELAIDIMWLLISVDPYQRLVRGAGWPLARYEAWLADTFCQQLLG